MFKIIVEGEVVETVIYDDEYGIKEYIHQEYERDGIKARYIKMG